MTAMQEAADGEKEWSDVATSAWAAFGSSALNAIATVIEALGSKMLISAINSAADAAAQASTYRFVQAGLSSFAANKYAYGAVAAYTAAGVVRGLASNLSSMATGGIVEPSSGGSLIRVAENNNEEGIFIDYPRKTTKIS